MNRKQRRSWCRLPSVTAFDAHLGADGIVKLASYRPDSEGRIRHESGEFRERTVLAG